MLWEVEHEASNKVCWGCGSFGDIIAIKLIVSHEPFQDFPVNCSILVGANQNLVQDGKNKAFDLSHVKQENEEIRQRNRGSSPELVDTCIVYT